MDLFLACNADRAFFTDEQVKPCTLWTCFEVCKSICCLLDNIFVPYKNAVYRKKIGITMGTNCTPLIAHMFLYWYERLNTNCQSRCHHYI